MRLIRLNTFETNSSSCHSVTILKTKDFVKFKNANTVYIGEYEYSDDHDTYYNELNSEDFLTVEEVRDRVIKYISSELNMCELKDHDQSNGWGNNYRSAEFLLHTNPKLSFYKRALSDKNNKDYYKVNYKPTVFDSELKRDHYGQKESNLSVSDWIIDNFLRNIYHYVKDFIFDIVLDCQSGMESYYRMFECDSSIVGSPIEVGDQTIIKTYISC